MNGFYSPDSCNGFPDGAFKFAFKVMLIGDSCVGKTCLLVRFKDNMFLHNNFIATVGMDYRNKILDVDGTKVKLQIWDTAGQERFRCLTHAYYRDADAVILTFDMASRATFEHTRSWIADVEKHGRDGVLIVLVGNKSDLSNLRQVTAEEAMRTAEACRIIYAETSGKTGANVDALFMKIAQELLKRQTGQCDQSSPIDFNSNQEEGRNKKGLNCCW